MEVKLFMGQSAKVRISPTEFTWQMVQPTSHINHLLLKGVRFAEILLISVEINGQHAKQRNIFDEVIRGSEIPVWF